MQMLLSNAQLIYQGKHLFDDLSVPLYENQWMAILGTSGAGKTSLLRMIAGLPTGGKTSAEKNIHKKELAYMAQTDLLLPWLNVLDNVLIGAKLRNESFSKIQAINILEEMGLGDSLTKKPHELSGGMRQRVALARTLFEDKKIILMDEPFSSLDAITKYKLQYFFKEHLKHKTILLITHDPLEAIKLADHIFVLSGTPATLKPVLTKNYESIMGELCAE